MKYNICYLGILTCFYLVRLSFDFLTLFCRDHDDLAVDKLTIDLDLVFECTSTCYTNTEICAVLIL